jgi:hypothetical protein
MKRYLAGAAALGCLFAIGAATATAANFDPTSESGFISRGDVIAAGGKGALISNPVVTYSLTMRSRLTCTWPDGTQFSTILTSVLFRNFNAAARYAPGSENITGYSVSKDNEFNSEIDPPFFNDQAICGTLHSLPADGTPVLADVEQISTSSALTFFTAPGQGFTVGP